MIVHDSTNVQGPFVSGKGGWECLWSRSCGFMIVCFALRHAGGQASYKIKQQLHLKTL